MNSLQIQTNRSKDSKSPVLTTEKSLEIIQKASTGVKVSVTGEIPLKDFLSTEIAKCFVLIGTDKPSKEDINIIVLPVYSQIRERFSSFTAFEIQKAFEMGVYSQFGEFNKRLPVSVFIFFLDSYKKHKESTQRSIAGVQNALSHHEEDKVSAQEIKSLNDEFLQNKYQEFCELLQEGEKMVNNSQNISFNLSDVDIASYLSAIKDQSSLIISINQMNWINKTIDSMAFDFDPYKFGTGSGAKTSFDNHKKSEKHKAFKVLQLELHFCNVLSQRTGVSSSSFFTFSQFNKTA